jgi:hypothetical protein
MTYADLIATAMKGKGRMHNEQIYFRVWREARRHKQRLSFHWAATVRNTLQRHSKQSRKGRPPFLFIHHDRNIWECRK